MAESHHRSPCEEFRFNQRRSQWNVSSLRVILKYASTVHDMERLKVSLDEAEQYAQHIPDLLSSDDWNALENLKRRVASVSRDAGREPRRA